MMVPKWIVLVIYEYVITIDREMQTVWCRRWTASSFLLLSSRWVMVLSAVRTLSPIVSRLLLVTISCLFALEVCYPLGGHLAHY